jgi:DeoR/GlpR family transcriptional regulator of sugar metabolism
MSTSKVFHRREKILKLLSEQQEITVNELAAYFNVSGWTIRRDLIELESRSQIQRSHGAAQFHAVDSLKPLDVEREATDEAAKQRIGRKAAQFVKTGQFIVLGAGSTTAYVAKALTSRQHIQIMTNALNLAMELSDKPGLQVTCTGGMVDGTYYTLTGPVTERSLRNYYYDVAIIGISGIDLERGVTVNSQLNAASLEIMLRHSQKRILVADHTKFNQVSYYFLADLDSIDLIITDQPPPDQYMAYFENSRTRIVIA